MTYPETHPIFRLSRNNKEGQTDTGFNLNACNYLKQREKEYRINMVKEHLP
jgi:hypothetical protein